MALSQVTQENINEAEGMIRNALHHASRNERPYIIKELSQILWSLHQLESSDKVLDMVQDLDLQDNIKKDPF
tara:strand:+ start:609 stop:824 length:216 start_codon:yes stop_codon:yes gene_type:complete